MSDLTLADGREIDIDLEAITIKEYRELFSPKQSAAEETAVLAKAAGMTSEEVEGLSMLDYKRLLRALLEVARQPLADPT